VNRLVRNISIGSIAACAIVALAAVPARAGDAKADIKAMLDAQAKAIVSGDVEAFVHTIGLDSFTVLPGGMGETPVQAAIASRHSWHDAGATAAKYGKVVIGVDGTVAWVTAELAVTMKSKVTAYRVSELLTRRPGGWAARAMMVSRPVAKFTGSVDDDSLAVVPGAAPAPEKVAMADWITDLGGLGPHLRAGKDVVVLGSAAGQRGDGAAAAKSLLAAWKKRTFIAQDLRGGSDDTSYAYVFGVIRDADGGAPSWVLLEGVRHGDAWDVVGVHVSQDRPVGKLAEDD
jgi:SnoaL-like domain